MGEGDTYGDDDTINDDTIDKEDEQYMTLNILDNQLFCCASFGGP